jgi:hypothetical protein
MRNVTPALHICGGVRPAHCETLDGDLSLASNRAVCGYELPDLGYAMPPIARVSTMSAPMRGLVSVNGVTLSVASQEKGWESALTRGCCRPLSRPIMAL